MVRFALRFVAASLALLGASTAVAQAESPALRIEPYDFRLRDGTTMAAERGRPTQTQVPAAVGPLLGLSASDSSITGAGPEMPPSFRTRQKWTIISTEATIGMPMQCQM